MFHGLSTNAFVLFREQGQQVAPWCARTDLRAMPGNKDADAGRSARVQVTDPGLR